MDYAALFAAGVAGLVIGAFISNRLNRKDLNRYCALLDEYREENKTLWNVYDVLNSLRANCFLTNERGHRVRYADASVEVRARAEGSN